MTPFSDQLRRNGAHMADTDDIERRLTLLGAGRRKLGESLMPDRFEAAARTMVSRIAEDIVHEHTDLDAADDWEAYQFALKDLTALLVGHVTANLTEQVLLWVKQRKAQ